VVGGRGVRIFNGEHGCLHRTFYIGFALTSGRTTRQLRVAWAGDGTKALAGMRTVRYCNEQSALLCSALFCDGSHMEKLLLFAAQTAACCLSRHACCEYRNGASRMQRASRTCVARQAGGRSRLSMFNIALWLPPQRRHAIFVDAFSLAHLHISTPIPLSAIWRLELARDGGERFFDAQHGMAFSDAHLWNGRPGHVAALNICLAFRKRHSRGVNGASLPAGVAAYRLSACATCPPVSRSLFPLFSSLCCAAITGSPHLLT